MLKRLLASSLVLGLAVAWAGACNPRPDRTFVELDDGGGGIGGSGGGSGGSSGSGGAMVDSGSACVAEGETCDVSLDCCGFDQGARCVTFVNNDVACAGPCLLDSDCDSGCCVVLANDLGACSPTADNCSAGCSGAGEVCGSTADCCTGYACTNDNVGPKTCGAQCTADADCNSSCCVTESATQSACFAPEFCLNCNDTCASANNATCEEDTGLCSPGTDCTDCGAVQNPCENDCVTANDDECDDGGPGAAYSICALGTDCADCGARLCTDTCTLAVNGVCDDGGPSSASSACALGTDCTDCQVRGITCDETCQYARDGECDDGGPESLTSLCALGSDCTDCGGRPL